MYGIYTRHTARPGQGDQLASKLLAAGELLRDNPDCLLWIINRTDEPDVLLAYVVWTSKEAHDRGLTPEAMSDEMKALMGETRQFMAEDARPEQVFMTPIGGKGL